MTLVQTSAPVDVPGTDNSNLPQTPEKTIHANNIPKPGQESTPERVVDFKTHFNLPNEVLITGEILHEIMEAEISLKTRRFHVCVDGPYFVPRKDVHH
jgi:hypothetical protein